MRESLESFSLLSISGCECGAHVIKSQVDVVQWISDLMRNRRSQPADHCCFLGLVELGFELSCPTQLGCHVIEGSGQLANLITSVRGSYADSEIPGSDSPRSDG